jgi:hypothetical protein
MQVIDLYLPGDCTSRIAVVKKSYLMAIAGSGLP